MNWEHNEKRKMSGTFENRIFSETRKLIATRQALNVLSDTKNVTWMTPHNIHVAGFIRHGENKKLYCLFNYKNTASFVTWYAFKEYGERPSILHDHWTEQSFKVGNDNEYFVLPPFSFAILESVNEG
jgi:amylosucrase